MVDFIVKMWIVWRLPIPPLGATTKEIHCRFVYLFINQAKPEIDNFDKESETLGNLLGIYMAFQPIEATLILECSPRLL